MQITEYTSLYTEEEIKKMQQIAKQRGITIEELQRIVTLDYADNLKLASNRGEYGKQNPDTS